MNWMYWCQLLIAIVITLRIVKGLIAYFGEIQNRIDEIDKRKTATSTQKGLAILIGLSVFAGLWLVILWVFYTAGTFSELF